MQTRIAIIADPHFHDVDYRQGVGRRAGVALRTLADTAESTRVFNESFHALPRLLDNIVARGLEIVVVAGDLTDDGQQSTMAATVALMKDYSSRFGLRFFATPGNHDLYSIHGRHHGKRFLDPGGGHTLVTSDTAMPAGPSAGRIVSPQMYCGGYASALPAMAEFGFFPQDRFLHWETPFGQAGQLAERSFDIASADGSIVRRMPDASYLVEPVRDLWLLSIDANVFEPKDGGLDPKAETSYIDSTDAGWNSVLRNKPFLLGWMRDVARRAEAGGKRLIAFSHYPALDPLGGALADEVRLFGETTFARRTPRPAASAAVAATGIKVHFSGHLHINDTAIRRQDDAFLVNVSVPSMVGFPPAYKIASFDGGRLCVETVRLFDIPGFDVAFDGYRAEIACSGATHAALVGARSHADFLDRHLAETVRHRYLPREWPPDLAGLACRLSLAELERLAATPEPVDAAGLEPAGEGASPAMLDMIVDWYRLRMGRGLALEFIAADRLETYRRLAGLFAAGDWPEASLQARLAVFARMMMAYLAAPPSLDFSIDLRDGRVEEAVRGYFGRTERRHMGRA